MGHKKHKADAPSSLKVAILSISSTRTLENDESGHWIASRAKKEGHTVVDHKVVDDDAGAIRQALLQTMSAEKPHGVILTGGTGISPKDVTIEAVKPMFAKELSAFAILFTQLSFDQIDSAAMLSRATAGVIGNALVFCIPGSLNACKLACGELIFPELGHLVRHATVN